MIIDIAIAIVILSGLAPDSIKAATNFVKGLNEYGKGYGRMAQQAVGLRRRNRRMRGYVATFNRGVMSAAVVGLLFLAFQFILALGWLVGCFRNNKPMVLVCGGGLIISQFIVFLCIKAVGELFKPKEPFGQAIGLSAMFIMVMTLWFVFLGFHGMTHLGLKDINGWVILSVESIALGFKIKSELDGKPSRLAQTFHFWTMVAAIVLGLGLKIFAADMRVVDAHKAVYDKDQSVAASPIEAKAFNTHGYVLRPAVVWDLTFDDQGQVTKKEQKADPKTGKKPWLLDTGKKFRATDAQVPTYQAAGTLVEIQLPIDGSDEYDLPDPADRMFVEEEKVQLDTDRFAKTPVFKQEFDIPPNAEWFPTLDVTGKYVRIRVRKGQLWSNTSGPGSFYQDARGNTRGTTWPGLVVAGQPIRTLVGKTTTNTLSFADAKEVGDEYVIEGTLGNGMLFLGQNDTIGGFGDNAGASQHVTIEFLE